MEIELNCFRGFYFPYNVFTVWPLEYGEELKIPLSRYKILLSPLAVLILPYWVWFDFSVACGVVRFLSSHFLEYNFFHFLKETLEKL